MKKIYFSEVARMIARSFRVRFSGLKKYDGNSESICNKIILDCYNKDKGYFTTSTGHFKGFYARDFGWCARSLISLGHKKKVASTLDYALNVFQKHGRIEQSITPNGNAFTFPDLYSPDALAFLILSLKELNDKKLVAKYKPFLEREIVRYFEIAVDKKTGLIRKEFRFSSMKDYSNRESSCYDNIMTAMLARDLDYLDLINPFKKYDYEKIIKKHFWQEDYFLDELSGRKAVCGDANTLPFWSKIFEDKDMMKKVINKVKKEKLDSPFTLKYTSGFDKNQKMIWQELFAGNYERDTIWAHVGLMYVEVLAMVDKKLAKQQLVEYEKKIVEHKTFLEVYDKNGEPFKTLFYYSDEGMIWCANFLYLKKLLR